MRLSPSWFSGFHLPWTFSTITLSLWSLSDTSLTLADRRNRLFSIQQPEYHTSVAMLAYELSYFSPGEHCP